MSVLAAQPPRDSVGLTGTPLPHRRKPQACGAVSACARMGDARASVPVGLCVSVAMCVGHGGASAAVGGFGVGVSAWGAHVCGRGGGGVWGAGEKWGRWKVGSGYRGVLEAAQNASWFALCCLDSQFPSMVFLRCPRFFQLFVGKAGHLRICLGGALGWCL